MSEPGSRRKKPPVPEDQLRSGEYIPSFPVWLEWVLGFLSVAGLVVATVGFWSTW